MLYIYLILILVAIILSYIILNKENKENTENNKNITSKSVVINNKTICYPNASPIDAQFGSISYISSQSNIPKTKRRFFIWNNSDKTMYVRSFTFGGYNRKYRGITEMIAPNLMEQYGYTNIIPPNDIFCLDTLNDKHIMYKGWYNSPIFIAYTLGETTLDSEYEIIAWHPMRIQDQKSTYEYFYDDKLKQYFKNSIKNKNTKEGKGIQDYYDQVLNITKSFEMVRNACIHWKTGKNIGDASPLENLGHSQCKYYTELETFEPVNVKIPACHLVVNFNRKTGFIRDTYYGEEDKNMTDLQFEIYNRDKCMRLISEAGSSYVMKKAEKLDNFIQDPNESWMYTIDTIVGTVMWFYVQIGGIVINTLAAVLNNVIPGSGTLISMAYFLIFQTALPFIMSSGILAKIPGIGKDLDRIGLEFSQGNTVTQIASPILSVVGAATSIAAGNYFGAVKLVVKERIKLAIQQAFVKTIFYIGGKGYQALKNDIMERVKGKFNFDSFVFVISDYISQAKETLSTFTTPMDVLNAMDMIKRSSDVSDENKELVNMLSTRDKEILAKSLSSLFNDKDFTGEFTKNSGEEIGKEIKIQIDTMASQLLPEPVSRGVGKEDFEWGDSGKKGYSSREKFSVNKAFRDGKLPLETRCSGVWNMKYIQ